MAQENNEPNPELEATVDAAIEAVLPDRAESPVSEQPAQEAVDSSVAPSEEIESGKEAAAAAEPKSWYSETDKELALSYGFADDDLKDFADAKEFNRVTRLLDRQLVRSVEAQRPAPPAEETPPATEPHKQNGHTPPATPVAAPKFAKHDLAKLREEGYGDTELAHFEQQNKLIEHIEQQEQSRVAELDRLQKIEQGFNQFQQQLVQADQQRRWNSFHESVDHLGPDRFGKAFGDNGKPVALTKEQDDARRKLYDTAETIAAGMQARGQDIPAMSVLLRRAEQLAFADDIAKTSADKVRKEILDQSKRRRPVAQSRSPGGQFAGKPLAALPQHERISAIAADPDLQTLHKQFQEANGAAV